jgi:hypothetical protein
MHVLTTTIQPQTWSDLGGAGTITNVAGMLVVLQTPRVHEQIATLLDDLRKQGAAINSLTVRAYWVVSNEIGSLLIDHRRVNRDLLVEQMKTRGAVGQISCFDSQTVHLVMGNIRSVITSVTPVVGQSEKSNLWQYAGAAQDQVAPRGEATIPDSVLGQLAESGGGREGGSGFTADGGGSLQAGGGAGSFRAGGVGYQPITRTNIFGGLLQVTPSLDPSGRSAILDVQSIVIRPNTEQQAPVEFNNVTKLERINVVMQQFKTTLRLPINQPVLVAGSTLEPLQNKEAREQLYLIMEVLTDEVPPVTQPLPLQR